MSEIICQDCKKPIAYRRELTIAGKMFGTWHNDCYKKKKGRRFLFGYSITSPQFLIYFLVLLALPIWVEWIPRVHFDRGPMILWLFGLTAFVVARLGAYLFIERKLPK